MSSVVKEKKDELLGQATEEAKQKPEQETPEQTENRSDAKERVINYKPDAEGRVSTEGLDQSLVKQAKRGSMFGEKDYARYQAMLKGGDGGQASEGSSSENTSNIPEQGQSNRMVGTKMTTKPVSNMSPHDRLKAETEADWVASNKAFNVDNMIQANIKNATNTTKAADMYRGLKQGVHDTSAYYRNRSNLTTLGIFGDIWNTNQRPDWSSPEKPDLIETTYDKKKDKD